jgi:hypothetical protein
VFLEADPHAGEPVTRGDMHRQPQLAEAPAALVEHVIQHRRNGAGRARDAAPEDVRIQGQAVVDEPERRPGRAADQLVQGFRCGHVRAIVAAYEPRTMKARLPEISRP